MNIASLTADDTLGRSWLSSALDGEKKSGAKFFFPFPTERGSEN
jgi:hypothetical protein